MSDPEEARTEETPEEGTEQEGEGSPEPEVAQTPPAPPRQVVQIKTPLDRPEFSWFLNTFMKRTGITDKTQAAIMLSNMLYDMGVDPYADLADVQRAIEEMNLMLKNLPDTPTSNRVKDTLGGMMAARAGRSMLQTFPKVIGSDPLMDRFEKIMDKYTPMLMGMRMMTDMMKGEPGQSKQTEIPETLRNELGNLKTGLTGLQQSLETMRNTEKEKAMMDAIIGQVNAQITPQIQSLQTQVGELAKRPETPPPQPSRSEDLLEIREELRKVTDKLGEKAGAQKITLDDVDSLVTVLDKFEKFYKKEPSGEFDWRAATVSTFGEVGKEFISAYKEIQTSKSSSEAPQIQTQTPAAEMQAIIKRQVQNYIMQRLKAGAAQMNIQEAAATLGLTPQQVAWAYQTLMNEGWINVRVPTPSKPERKMRETIETAEETTPSTEEAQTIFET